MELNEARKRLELALGEDFKAQYFGYLNQWFSFSPSLTRDTFDEKVRKLFQNVDQVHCHNDFLLAILNKAHSPSKSKPSTQANRSLFEPADFMDYVTSKDSPRNFPSTFSYHRAATDLLVPDNGFISCRINIVAWDCGMEGADNKVTPLIVHACQTFLKNIITAMASKAKGFKIRDGKFQYGFNMPIPDPHLRNSSNVVDDTLESDILDDGQLLSKCKMSLEKTQQQRAFAYAASKTRKTGVVLNTKLLYETIRENPSLLGQQSFHSLETLKLSLRDYPEDSFSDGSDS